MSQCWGLDNDFGVSCLSEGYSEPCNMSRKYSQDMSQDLIHVAKEGRTPKIRTVIYDTTNFLDVRRGTLTENERNISPCVVLVKRDQRL